MRTAAALLFALVFAAVSARPLRAEEVPLEQIQSAIAEGVGRIIACQQADGSFLLSEPHVKDYPAGMTALAVMALQYARPHLTGQLRVDAMEAIRKGIASIAQTAPEQRTYSSGFIICALFQENPETYKKMIGFYAAMFALSQHDKAYESGEWGYRLKLPPGPQGEPRGPAVDAWGDKSNTQLALLGLYYANRAGFQVPKIVWARSREHYIRVQFADGGWGYMPTLRPDPYANMTIASTISLNLCEEMLFAQEHKQCQPPPRSAAIENGLKWIAENWEKQKIGSDTYGLYALERLGIIMGRANIGSHDWFNEGARTLVGRRRWSSFAGSPEVSTCFGVMFLARGLEPIVINKLERRGTDDWNNDPYDVKHLVEFIQDHYQLPIQWRIVSLVAPLDLLLRTPILYISGHRKLDFNEEERKKLKAYVDGGGTILGQGCCAKKEFDESFRQVMKDLFDGELKPVPKTHVIYQRMKIRDASPNPVVEMLTLDREQGRPAVIYLPHDQCCRWHAGGTEAYSSYAVGTGIYFYVTIEVKKMYQRDHPAAAPPATPVPEPVPAPEPAPAPTPGPGGSAGAGK